MKMIDFVAFFVHIFGSFGRYFKDLAVIREGFLRFES